MGCCETEPAAHFYDWAQQEREVLKMRKKDIKASGSEEKFLQELGAETFDLVIDHELHGVTPEMIDWWWKNMVNSQYYQLWHPKDHISIEWEVRPTREGNVGAIHVVVERIGEIPAQRLRVRVEDSTSSPIPTTYSHVRPTSMLGPDNKPVSWTTHEYEAAPYGTRMRSTFRVSAKTPQRFRDALRQHNKEEMGQFPEFLPELYKKSTR
jgi:hypothetical protein